MYNKVMTLKEVNTWKKNDYNKSTKQHGFIILSKLIKITISSNFTVIFLHGTKGWEVQYVTPGVF